MSSFDALKIIGVSGRLSKFLTHSINKDKSLANYCLLNCFKPKIDSLSLQTSFN